MRLLNFETAAFTFRGDAPSAIVPKYSEVEHPTISHLIFSHSLSSGFPVVVGASVVGPSVVGPSVVGASVVGASVLVGSHNGALYDGLKHSVDELDIASPLQVVNFFIHDLIIGALCPK